MEGENFHCMPDSQQVSRIEKETDKNVLLISDFVEHLKLHQIEVPENVIVGFFEK